jgi:hypothetical protein
MEKNYTEWYPSDLREKNPNNNQVIIAMSVDELQMAVSELNNIAKKYDEFVV